MSKKGELISTNWPGKRLRERREKVEIKKEKNRTFFLDLPKSFYFLLIMKTSYFSKKVVLVVEI